MCLLKYNQPSNLSGISVASSAPSMNHLLFAYDSMLLFKANVEGANVVSNLMDTYCSASGQLINNNKFSIFYIPEVVRDSVKNTLNVQRESLSDKYMGMSTDVGHSKNRTFRYLRDHV